MRQVVVYELLSLDGVAEQPDEFITIFDDAMRENLRRVIATQDTVVLGRRTYDEWARFWPTSEIEPFATFINGVEKFVATSTPPDEAWANATVVDGGLVEFVTELKKRSGGDIGVHGSIELTQSLLEEGLVDELRLVIAPALHMRGRKLFDRGLPRPLTLTRQVTSPSGHLLLDFKVGA
jgi:dihydrofolate reductase